MNEVARQMPNEAANTSKFVVRITGDNDEGKRRLDDFIHPEHRYPVIATTSKLLTTGVDAKTCKLIVLDQRIESMIEFKQIVGRGTRIHEDAGKLWFTIMDFKKATELFADPDFDGEPVVIYEPGDGTAVRPVRRRRVTPTTMAATTAGIPTHPPPPGPTQVRRERRRSLGRRRARPVLRQRRQAHHRVADGLHAEDGPRAVSPPSTISSGAGPRPSARQPSSTSCASRACCSRRCETRSDKDLDAFDLICHVAFDRPPLTRRERAENVKKRDVFTKYGEQARAVLDALLDKYADEGLAPVEDLGVLRVQPLSEPRHPRRARRALRRQGRVPRRRA